MTVVRETPSATLRSRSLGQPEVDVDPAVADQQAQLVGEPGVRRAAVEVAGERRRAAAAAMDPVMQSTLSQLAIDEKSNLGATMDP